MSDVVEQRRPIENIEIYFDSVFKTKHFNLQNFSNSNVFSRSEKFFWERAKIISRTWGLVNTSFCGRHTQL